MLRRTIAFAWVGACACGAAPPAAEQSSPQPTVPAPGAAPRSPTGAPTPAPVDAEPGGPAAMDEGAAAKLLPGPSLCEAMCAGQQQARAVAADVIDRECAQRCDASTAKPDPACDRAAAAARARVEAVPMRRRARRVWTELAKPALHCGYADALLRGLGAAGSAKTLDEREDALLRALRADPLADFLCPQAPKILDRAVTLGVPGVIEACAIEGMDARDSINRDLAPMTVLARAAVRLRWEAAGMLDGDRRVLLGTILLSSALERDHKRRP